MSSLKNLSLLVATLFALLVSAGCATRHIPTYNPNDAAWTNAAEARLQFCQFSANWSRVQVEYKTISPPNAAGMFGGVATGDTSTVAAEAMNSSTSPEGCPAVLASDLMKIAGRVDMGAVTRTYHFRVYPHPDAHRLLTPREKPEAEVDPAVEAAEEAERLEALRKKCQTLADQGKRLPKRCLEL